MINEELVEELLADASARVEQAGGLMESGRDPRTVPKQTEEAIADAVGIGLESPAAVLMQQQVSVGQASWPPYPAPARGPCPQLLEDVPAVALVKAPARSFYISFLKYV